MLPPILVVGTGVAAPPTDVEREMAAGAAEQLGEPVEELLAEWGALQPPFMAATEEVVAMETYAWSDVRAGEGYEATVAFKGAAPERALDLMATLPRTTRVLQDAPLTEGERLAAQHPACEVIFERARGVGDATCGTDQVTLEIEGVLHGQPPSDFAPLEAEALAAARAAVADPGAAALISVTVLRAEDHGARAHAD